MDRNIRSLVGPMSFVGFAKTTRYVPTNRKIRTMTPEDYNVYVGQWYNEPCPYRSGEVIEAGDFICVDASNLDVGLLGSENVLRFINSGPAAL